MLAIKISLTITIIAAFIAFMMILPDRKNKYSSRYEWYPITGGLAVIVALVGAVTTAILTIWQVLPS